MKIGISLNFNDENGNIWVNEKIQQSIFLYLLLSKIDKNKVYLINCGIDIDSLSNENKNYISDIDIIEYDEKKVKKLKLNIFIDLNNNINTIKTLKKNKNNKTKIIKFETTNTYIDDVNNILNNSKKVIVNIYDEIWTYEINKSYLEELYRLPVYNVPFIWDSFFIEKEKNIIEKNYNIIYNYTPTNKKKNITIFDDNTNIDNMSIYSLLLIERTYNNNKNIFKEKVEKIRILNSIKFKDNVKFLSFIKQLNIHKDGFCSFEGKYPTPIILSKYTDVVITSSFINPLKHLYLEILYGNYPLIHNSNILKNNTYHYNNFNLNEAENRLIDVLSKHDSKIPYYESKVDKILNMFSINNDTIIDKYDFLIKNDILN